MAEPEQNPPAPESGALPSAAAPPAEGGRRVDLARVVDRLGDQIAEQSRALAMAQVYAEDLEAALRASEEACAGLRTELAAATSGQRAARSGSGS